MAGVRSVLVPGSILSETSDPKVATYKIGLIGRACAMFGVDEIVVYEDADRMEGRTAARILEYQGSAPYLRKRLFPISDELAHVGVLPPLNLPLHLVENRAEPGQVRLGTMVGSQVEIGLALPADLRLKEGEEPPPPGAQFAVVVRGVRAGSAFVELRRPGPGEYHGFAVARAPSIRTAMRGRAPLLGTSRTGEPFTRKHLSSEGVALVFGSPDKGIQEILGEKPKFPLVNTVPGQATRTVRTEEAILVTLGLIHAAALAGPE